MTDDTKAFVESASRLSTSDLIELSNRYSSSASQPDASKVVVLRSHILEMLSDHRTGAYKEERSYTEKHEVEALLQYLYEGIVWDKSK